MPRAAVLALLPYPDLMKRRLRFWTMLDAIMAPDMRSFEFHPKWGKSQQMGGFKDGEGNFFFAWFCAKGCVIRGFHHESAMSPFRVSPPKIWPGIFDGLPKSLAYANQEPAFALDEVTFAAWAMGKEGEFVTGPVKLPKGKDPDGAKEVLFGCFSRKARSWGGEYYGDELDPVATRRLWNEEPIDRASLEALNPEFDEEAVEEEASSLSGSSHSGSPLPSCRRDGLRKKSPRHGVRFAVRLVMRSFVFVPMLFALAGCASNRRSWTASSTHPGVAEQRAISGDAILTGASLPPAPERRRQGGRLLLEADAPRKAGIGGPLFEATVDGKHGIFLVDTTSSRPILASWFARELDASTYAATLAAKVPGMDRMRAFNNSGTGVANLPFRVDILPVGFETAGVAGKVSPLSLADALGLPIELALNDGRMVVLSNATTFRGSPLAACARGDGDALVVMAIVDGKEGRFLVDTTRIRTTIPGSAKSNVTIAVGGKTAMISAVDKRDETRLCDEDGRLGLDVLAFCTFRILPIQDANEGRGSLACDTSKAH